MMKKAFYFIWKAFFILKIFNLLSYFLVILQKRLDQRDKVNFEIYDVKAWLAKCFNTDIVQYLTK